MRCAQSSVLIFVSDCCSFAGPVLLQYLLEYLEDRSSIGECINAVSPAPENIMLSACCRFLPYGSIAVWNLPSFKS